jgi:hypothetical protein
MVKLLNMKHDTKKIKDAIKELIRKEMYGDSSFDLSDEPSWDFDDYFDGDVDDEWEEDGWDDEECNCSDDEKDEDGDWEEEDDHEGSMAKSDLASISTLAAEINDMIEEDSELEGWVQAKITKAADYIEAVHKYMKYDY